MESRLFWNKTSPPPFFSHLNLWFRNANLCLDLLWISVHVGFLSRKRVYPSKAYILFFKYNIAPISPTKRYYQDLKASKNTLVWTWKKKQKLIKDLICKRGREVKNNWSECWREKCLSMIWKTTGYKSLEIHSSNILLIHRFYHFQLGDVFLE